jgi:hypothetical protein
MAVQPGTVQKAARSAMRRRGRGRRPDPSMARAAAGVPGSVVAGDRDVLFLVGLLSGRRTLVSVATNDTVGSRTGLEAY